MAVRSLLLGLGLSATLQPGSPAPFFSAPDQSGKRVTLAELRGHPIVLYFYPKDGTPG